MNQPQAIILVPVSDEGYVAVKFGSLDSARRWEDQNDIMSGGVIRLVSPQEALRLTDL